MTTQQEKLKSAFEALTQITGFTRLEVEEHNHWKMPVEITAFIHLLHNERIVFINEIPPVIKYCDKNVRLTLQQDPEGTALTLYTQMQKTYRWLLAMQKLNTTDWNVFESHLRVFEGKLVG